MTPPRARGADVDEPWPPPFPRIPRLVVDGEPCGDLVLSSADARRWLQRPCVVEEKLDGANVALWVDAAGGVVSSGRAGLGSSDRAQQFGRLRAWGAKHAVSLRPLLANGDVLYAEWLYRTHTTAYDALPDFLVALDLWSPSMGFASVDERDRRCRAVGVATPPILQRGVLGSVKAARGLHGVSAFGHEAAEGLVLRFEEAGRLVMRAKLLRADFVPKTDLAWAREPLRCNKLARPP